MARQREPRKALTGLAHGGRPDQHPYSPLLPGLTKCVAKFRPGFAGSVRRELNPPERGVPRFN
jgi:hypothetical protein